MGRYFPGLNEAQDNVRNGTLEDALRVIDNLYGRDNLNYGDDENAVKAEAIRQLEIEFRNPEYQSIFS